MKVKAVDHVAVTVSDTERALDFYVGKLGLKQVEQHQLEGDKCDAVSGFKGTQAQSTRLIAEGTPNILIDLLELFEPKLEPAQPPFNAVGSCHFALVVDDLPNAVKELKSKGIEFTSPPVTFDITSGAVTVCFCKDPDGNHVELMEEYVH